MLEKNRLTWPHNARPLQAATRCPRKLWAVGRQSGNWDLRPGCSVSTNWRLVGTVHEFESTRSQMDSITMATAIRSKKWKATASPGGENREAGAGAGSASRRLISTVCCG